MKAPSVFLIQLGGFDIGRRFWVRVGEKRLKTQKNYWIFSCFFFFSMCEKKDLDRSEDCSNVINWRPTTLRVHKCNSALLSFLFLLEGKKREIIKGIDH